VLLLLFPHFSAPAAAAAAAAAADCRLTATDLEAMLHEVLKAGLAAGRSL
jgi:hypothetical protein